MAGNKATSAGLDSPSSYEAAVLDFLDREMAAVQPSQKQNDQSDELDALVSDLLKQVIDESDKSENTTSGMLSELESLANEFPPAEESILYARSETPASTAAIPAAPMLKQQSSTSLAPEISGNPQSIPVAVPLFAPAFGAKAKNSTPKIAIASACLLIIMGLTGYYFMGSQKGASTTGNPALSSKTSASAASGGMIPAVPISQIAPRYPDSAVKTRAAASIVLDLQIDQQGKVVKAVAVSGPFAFHKEAVSAAMSWRFQPASVNGTNVASQSRVTMNFKP